MTKGQVGRIEERSRESKDSGGYNYQETFYEGTGMGSG